MSQPADQTTPPPQVQPIAEDPEYKQWLAFHEIQLYAIQFPPALYRNLYDKLKQEVFDIGFKVKIMVDQEEDRVDLQCSVPLLKKEEDVFLVDHLWTFKQRDAEKVLRSNDQLLSRMVNIVKHSEKLDLPSNPYEKKRPTLQEYLATLNESTVDYDFDEYGISSLQALPLSANAQTLSVFNNNIENPGEITTLLDVTPNLRALWVQGNPVVDNCVNFNQIGELFPQLEIINSKFTSRAGEWSFMYYAKDQQPQNLGDIRSLDLSGKGLLYLKDIEVFGRLTGLHTLDISDHPEFLQTDEELREEENKLKEGSPEEQEIEFSQRLHTIDELLLALPQQLRNLTCDEELETYILEKRASIGFLPNLRTLNGVSMKYITEEDRGKERKIRKVMRELWKYAGTYRIVSEEQMDEENIWYINDEIGSLFKHSDQPNFAMHPLIYAPSNKIDDPHTITYSVCWPLKNLGEGDIIYRDFLKGYDEEKFRSTRFTVWFNTPEEYFEEQLKIYQTLKPVEDAMSVHQSYQERYDPLPAIDAGGSQQLPIKVFSDYVQVLDHLKDPARFQLVDNPRDALIFWSSMDYYSIVQSQMTGIVDESKFYLNQFQFEAAFVAKHHLANLVRSTLSYPESEVIQETYVLNESLPAFVGRFNERQKLAVDNTWILKPTNMARSMDSWVTSNLEQILRVSESGPKIAQKYIERPCLFRGKKFDMRFVVLLKSVLPLETYIYEEFYTRHSNNQFEMDEGSFGTYETHFTVMNYSEGVKLTNIRYFDFEKEFNQENEGKITFAEVRQRIHQAIKTIFVAFQVKHGKDLEALPNEAYRRSRAMYGVDVMITDDFQPKILEVTFSPDCGRACKFNPNFFNEVFGCLFMNDVKNMIRI